MLICDEVADTDFLGGMLVTDVRDIRDDDVFWMSVCELPADEPVVDDTIDTLHTSRTVAHSSVACGMEAGACASARLRYLIELWWYL